MPSAPSSPRPIRAAALLLAAAAAFAVAAGPLLAHDVSPVSLQLKPGTTGFVFVADQGTCPATITAKTTNGAVVKVYALDMVKCDGSLLPGGGNSASVPNRIDQIFAIVADSSIVSAQSASIEVCWVGADFGKAGPCTENNCNPYSPHPVSVLVSPDATNAGNQPFGGFAGDPVATATGELFVDELPDLSLRGVLPLILGRHYSSRFVADGLPASRLGAGWRHSYDWSATALAGGIEITAPDGLQLRFEQGPFDLDWTLAKGSERPFALIDGAAGSHLLRDPIESVVRTFDLNGRMTRIDDLRGNALTLSYVSGRLATVADGLGRQFTFTYDGSNRLAQISDGTRDVGYAYDGMSRLASFTDAGNGVTAYAYSATLPSSALLASVTRPEGNVPWTQLYDVQGRVVTQQDADGNQRTFAYDDAAGETTVTEPLLATQVHTHVDGRLTRLQFEAGGAAAMTYDSAGRRLRVTDREGDDASIAWDSSSGFPKSATAADGTTLRFTWDPRSAQGFIWHDLGRITWGDGTFEEFTWDAGGNPLTRIDAAGSLWSRTYGVRSELLTATAPDGGVRTFGYRPDFLLDHVVDPAGRTTTFDYDLLGRMTDVLLPGGATRTATWDDLDRLLSVTDEAGDTTQFAWDGNSNLIATLLPGGRTWSFGYDPMDRLTSVLDPEGGNATFQFDPRGRPIVATDGDGFALAFDWSATGRLTGVTDGGARTVELGYDAEDVAASFTDVAGTRWFETNARGQWTKTTTAEARTFRITRDAGGQPTSLTDGEGGKTTIGRDANGQIVAIESTKAGAAVTIARDPVGRVVGIGSGGGGLGWAIGRDAAGEVTSAIDPIGREMLATLDARGRPDLLTFPAGLGDVQLGWSDRNELESATFSDGTLQQWQVDADSRVVGATGATITRDDVGRIELSNGIASLWGPGGRLQSMTIAPGLTVTYSYDPAGRLAQVDDGVGGTCDWAWDPAGRLDSRTFGNGAFEDYDWDADGLLSRFQLTLGVEVMVDLQFTRDAAGRIVLADRLQPVIGTPTIGATDRTFDAAGQDAAMTYDALGRRTGDGTRGWQYNLAGHLTDAFDGVDAYEFTWDAMGQVISGQLNTDPLVEYSWNYATTRPSLGVLREGGVDKSYYVSTPEGAPLWRVNAMSGAHRYYHFDEQGNTLVESNDAGAVSQAYAWGLQGELQASLNPVGGYPYAVLGAGARDYALSLGVGVAFGDRIWDTATGSTLQPTRDLAWLATLGTTPYGLGRFPQPSIRLRDDERASVLSDTLANFVFEPRFKGGVFVTAGDRAAVAPTAVPGAAARAGFHGDGFGGVMECGKCHPQGWDDDTSWLFPQGRAPRRNGFSLDSVAGLPTAGSAALLSGRNGGDARVLNWASIFDEIDDFEQNTRQPSLDPANAKKAIAKLLLWLDFKETERELAPDDDDDDEIDPETAFLLTLFVNFPGSGASSSGPEPLKMEKFGDNAIHAGRK